MEKMQAKEALESILKPSIKKYKGLKFYKMFYRETAKDNVFEFLAFGVTTWQLISIDDLLQDLIPDEVDPYINDKGYNTGLTHIKNSWSEFKDALIRALEVYDITFQSLLVHSCKYCKHNFKYIYEEENENEEGK